MSSNVKGPTDRVKENRIQAALENGRPERIEPDGSYKYGLLFEREPSDQLLQDLWKIRRSHDFRPELRAQLLDVQRSLTQAHNDYTEMKNDLVHLHGEDGRVGPEMDSYETVKAEVEALMNMEVEIQGAPLPWGPFEDKPFREEFDRPYEIGLIEPRPTPETAEKGDR